MLKTVADMPEAALLKLSGDVNHNHTLLEILAVAENVHTQIRSLLSPEKKILIVGAGTLGISVGLVLKHYGFEADIIEPIKSRIERSKKLGLRCFHPTNFMIDPSKKCAYDIVIDASGDHLNGKGGWNALDLFGAKYFTGIILAKYSKDVALKASVSFMKNASLRWIQGCTKESLKLAVQNWTGKVDELGQHMVSHVFDFSEVNDAFDMARDRENAGRVIIKVQDKLPKNT
jgi:threonine dehydrogenase-like Zn-dependent dehydrogenase